jgi:hypothetical protein
MDRTEGRTPEEVPQLSGRAKRAIRRAAVGLGMLVGTLLVIAAILYFFGGMEQPAPMYRAAYSELVAQGRVAPVRSGFAIPIPGCRCHSDDPVLQMEHSAYRVKDCTGCH